MWKKQKYKEFAIVGDGIVVRVSEVEAVHQSQCDTHGQTSCEIRMRSGGKYRVPGMPHEVLKKFEEDS